MKKRFSARASEVMTVAVAAAVATLGQLDVWAPSITDAEHMEGPKAVNSAAFLLAALLLLWRRRAPLAVLAGVAAVVAILSLAVGASESAGTFLPIIVATYAVARYEPAGRALLGVPIAFAAIVIHNLSDPAVSSVGEVVVFYAVVAVAAAIGRSLRAREHWTELLEDRALRLEREQEVLARAAVAEERTRSARDLHDVVAHAVSLSVLQAEPAEAALGNDPERAREPLQRIKRGGREALSEMRRLLATLRSQEEDQTAGSAPSVAGLGDLTERLGAAGLEVELRVQGEPSRLPPGVDRAAYRIVQEALTNSLRHGRSQHARVLVRYGADTLDLDILDDGRGGAAMQGRSRARGDARARGALRRRPPRGPERGRRLRGPRTPPTDNRGAVINALIVDDEALVREGLRLILEAEQDLEVVGEAADAAQAVSEVSGSSPTSC
jgi:signal transduction histidine kinase